MVRIIKNHCFYNVLGLSPFIVGVSVCVRVSLLVSFRPYLSRDGDRCRDRHRQTEIDRDKQRQIETDREKQRQTEADKGRYRQTERAQK